MPVTIMPRVTLGYPWEKIGDHFTCAMRLDGHEYDTANGYHAMVSVHEAAGGKWNVYVNGSGGGLRDTLDEAMMYAEELLVGCLQNRRQRALSKAREYEVLLE